jgi:hypothetical protein
MASINETVTTLKAVADEHYSRGVVDGIDLCCSVVQDAFRDGEDVLSKVQNIRAVMGEQTTS